jgi:hypothetical protein
MEMNEWKRKPKYLKENCSRAALSTKFDPGPNSGRRGRKPATNRLSYSNGLFGGKNIF